MFYRFDEFETPGNFACERVPGTNAEGGKVREKVRVTYEKSVRVIVRTQQKEARRWRADKSATFDVPFHNQARTRAAVRYRCTACFGAPHGVYGMEAANETRLSQRKATPTDLLLNASRGVKHFAPKPIIQSGFATSISKCGHRHTDNSKGTATAALPHKPGSGCFVRSLLTHLVYHPLCEEGRSGHLRFCHSGRTPA